MISTTEKKDVRSALEKFLAYTDTDADTRFDVQYDASEFVVRLKKEQAIQHSLDAVRTTRGTIQLNKKLLKEIAEDPDLEYATE
jgi:hypothetical protein